MIEVIFHLIIFRKAHQIGMLSIYQIFGSCTSDIHSEIYFVAEMKKSSEYIRFFCSSFVSTKTIHSCQNQENHPEVDNRFPFIQTSPAVPEYSRTRVPRTERQPETVVKSGPVSAPCFVSPSFESFFFLFLLFSLVFVTHVN